MNGQNGRLTGRSCAFRAAAAPLLKRRCRPCLRLIGCSALQPSPSPLVPLGPARHEPLQCAVALCSGAADSVRGTGQHRCSQKDKCWHSCHDSCVETWFSGVHPPFGVVHSVVLLDFGCCARPCACAAPSTNGRCWLAVALRRAHGCRGHDVMILDLVGPDAARGGVKVCAGRARRLEMSLLRLRYRSVMLTV